MALNSVFLRLGCEVVEFCDFDKNPKMEDLEKGIELLNDSGSSLVLAIGGGSVLDMAKLIRFFFSYSGDKTGNSFRKEQDLLPLIVLPTTAGTGSEATHFAVLYKDNIKYSVAHETYYQMLPLWIQDLPIGIHNILQRVLALMLWLKP